MISEHTLVDTSLLKYNTFFTLFFGKFTSYFYITIFHFISCKYSKKKEKEKKQFLLHL